MRRFTKVDVMKKVTFDRYQKAILESSGNLTVAGKKMGVTRAAVNKMVKNEPKLQEVVNEARLTLDDAIENEFLKSCLGNKSEGIPPNLTAMIFYMKTRMRYRGYVEKVVVEHSVEGIIDAWKRLSPEEQSRLIESLEEGEERDPATLN